MFVGFFASRFPSLEDVNSATHAIFGKYIDVSFLYWILLNVKWGKPKLITVAIVLQQSF